jgi:hypothetical protein
VRKTQAERAMFGDEVTLLLEEAEQGVFQLHGGLLLVCSWDGLMLARDCSSIFDFRQMRCEKREYRRTLNLIN